MGTRGDMRVTSGSFYKDMGVHGDTLGHPWELLQGHGGAWGHWRGTGDSCGNFHKGFGVRGDPTTPRGCPWGHQRCRVERGPWGHRGL